MADGSDHSDSHGVDNAALGETWAEHEKVLRTRARGLVRRTGGNAQDAEDLLHDTVCRVLTYPKNPEDLRNPVGYLSSVMRNVWVDNLRKKRVRTESLDEILSNPARQKDHPTVEPEVLRTAKHEELLEELRINQGHLNPDEKFLLSSLLAGRTLEEIAHALNEDVCRTKARRIALKAKLSYRVRSKSTRAKGSGRLK